MWSKLTHSDFAYRLAHALRIGPKVAAFGSALVLCVGMLSCGGGGGTTNSPSATAPIIIAQPSAVTVNEGQTASFTVAASGNPSPTFSWEKSTDGGSTWNVIGSATGSTYSYTTAFVDNGAKFRAKATNTVSTATSNIATLTVNAGPVFTVQPGNQTVTAGQTATFTVVASGNPAPTYVWEKSTDGGSAWSVIGGATNSTYSFTTAIGDNSAKFRAVATNNVNSATSAVATLTVSPAPAAPVITTQPVNQTVVVGNAATFNVAASGNPAPTYQWQRSVDGFTWVNVGGATNASYSFTTQNSDNGAKFRVVCSNGVGNPATSQDATLTVTTGALSFTLPGNVPLDLLPIPAGTFMMGRYAGEQDSNTLEDPQHQVTISQAFYMAKFETTQAQWVALMSSNPSYFTGDLNRPVERVSWDDISSATTGFLAKLNAQFAGQLPAGMLFRLPTEAEWEYAARAGTTTRFYWGDDPSYSQMKSYAWYHDNSENTTHPVGTRTANAFGLFDMSGNVREWCQDWFGSYSVDAQTDPEGSINGSNRINRGGGFGMINYGCRSAFRYGHSPSDRNFIDSGFRVVLAPAVSTTAFTLPGGVTLEMVSIPGGTFTMGSPDNEQDRFSSEGPQHQVTLSPFYMAKFETTQAQWVALMDSNPSFFPGDLNRPVEQVSWTDITQVGGFLEKLNTATAGTRPAGQVFRLPTEAEWEYACRAHTTTRFFWGDDLSYNQIGTYAWYYANSGDTLHPVGQKTPNAFGLYDMAGNNWEWCQDWAGAYASAAQTDPAGPINGSFRRIRGGWWLNSGTLRSAYRDLSLPDNRNNHVGFRLVLAPPRVP